MEHYITIAISTIGLTVLCIFSIIKAFDWLIGLKYLSKDEYKINIEHYCDDFSKKFATIESHNYLKEDIGEIKSKLNDIHEVVMTFTVNNFKDFHR